MRLVMRYMGIATLLLVLIASSTGNVRASVDAPAPEPETEADESTSVLFQMVAAGATYEAGVGSRDGVLTLIDLASDTIVFTDRPERVAVALSTDDVVDVLFAPVDGRNDDSFYANPPNAAFSCMSTSGDYARAIFVLQSPVASDSDLAFEVDVLFASGVGADEDEMLVCDGFTVRNSCLRHACATYAIDLRSLLGFHYLNTGFDTRVCMHVQPTKNVSASLLLSPHVMLCVSVDTGG